MTASVPRVWFITGASRGLGRALAAAALARGDQVAATARDPGALADLVATAPERARALRLDVSAPGEAAAAVAAAQAAFGRLDVIVNNAGFGLLGALEELTEDQMRRQWETNFLGAVHVVRAGLPLLRAQRGGHLVFISAAAAISNYPGFSLYGASKAAVEALGEAVAAETRPLGIKVTLVQPGPFRTDFVGRSLEPGAGTLPDYEATSGKFRRLVESTRGRQPGDPAKAAAAILAAVDAPSPPLRLVLGKYATDKARRRHTAGLRELEAWEGVGAAADF
jgi:NAD(P)-dependent dehydrogenase (short-subunit alcohol dehydrogenase family)